MHKLISVVALAGLIGGAGLWAAPAVASPECGAAYGKLVLKIVKREFKVAGKACKDGSGETPAAVDAEKAVKICDKLNSGAQKLLDKHGAGNCPFEQAGIDESVATCAADLPGQIQDLAVSFCNNVP